MKVLILLGVSVFHYRSERLDLPSPPGFCSTLAQTHVEATKDADNKLIVKVCNTAMISAMCDIIFTVNVLIFFPPEILGCRSCTSQASANESLYYVHGRKFYFYISNNDGWNAVPSTSESIALHSK